MHPDRRFHWSDPAEIRAFVADQSFGTLVLATAEGPLVAQVPVVVLDDDRLGFHLARNNALVPHLDGARALFVVQGPHGYVSPDWYGLDDQVPTWNYLTAQLEGPVRATDAAGLMTIIDTLSAAHEQRLAPKPVWTRDKMTPGVAERMARGIIGYELMVEAWRGTRKLGQNKADAVRLRAAEGLDAAGNAELAELMRLARQG